MRILFVKTSSLGDVIHHCPAVSDVRRRFPEAKIDWVVEEAFAEIPRLHPAIRRTIPVAVRRWRGRVLAPAVWSEILTFLRTLRAEPYDFVIDTQGLLKSALIVSRARGVKHGYDAESAREPLASRFYDAVHKVPRDLHAVTRNRALTGEVISSKPGDACDYGLQAAKRHAAPESRPYCVLLTMSSRANKLWPEQHWAELAAALAGRGLRSILPWGTELERARCHRIVALANSGEVAERMRLGDLADVMAQARMVVGIDTGLAHLAAALKVPVVGIYVQTDPHLTGLFGDGTVINLGGPGHAPSVRDVLESAKALI